MSKSIAQDMAYRQSLMKYAEKYGVSRASRKYNKGRSYIYFWKARWDGTVESLACQSRRPHSHPNQHTQEELKLIQDMRRRNPDLGLIELWSRMRRRGYPRRPESLYRVMRRLGLFAERKAKKSYFRLAENAHQHLIGYIVFSPASFEKEYSVESRTYMVSSDNKAFQPKMRGYSIFASSLDGSDLHVRLDQYMSSERGGPDGWQIERCYMMSDEVERARTLMRSEKEHER